MPHFFSHLHCSRCGESIREENTPVYLCPDCGGILETVFAYSHDFAENVRQADFNPVDVLPFDSKDYVYIGQGNTPLVKADALSREYGVRLLLKCEQQNPTGSFKDRPVSCGISKAVSLGYKQAVVASSGNGAAAVAAFSAKAGLKTRIYVPESTPDEKVKQAMMYGGDVIRIPGPYSNSYKAALETGMQEESYNLTTTFLNPFTIDGDKVVAYELYREIGVPDAIYVPIGAGPLLVGILKGFEELRDMGLVNRLPKMVGVQAQGCSPIVSAFFKEGKVVSERNPSTIASGICDGLVGYEQDGDYTISAVRRSHGTCVAIADEDIRREHGHLARTEGIFVEPSSVTGIAAVSRTGQQLAGEGGTVVAILTGHGLKDMKNAKID